MYSFVLIVHIIVSLVLVSVILLQAGKGGGLADTFGGGSSQTTIFGQKTAAFLTKATTFSAVLFLCTSLGLAVISSRRQKSLMESYKVPKPAVTEKAVPSETEQIFPESASQTETAKTTVRHVQVDPVTGEETVVKEETVPETE